ncbi:MAG: vWA domain-containing protein [Magnetovibrionaceae bacterium]
MKRRKRPLELFNLSFLDVISCGFGAVVLLVLISNYNQVEEPADTSAATATLAQVLATEKRVAEKQAEQRALDESLSANALLQDRFRAEAARLSAARARAKAASDQKAQSLEALSLAEEALKRASVTAGRKQTPRDTEVGGIPVDSDYVVFVIDTSGSMLGIWDRVVAELVNVISIHPRIVGFQVLNDNGQHLISSYAGKWIPDTPGRRASVIKLLKSWRSVSNSSPVEGLTVALQRYAKPGRSLSIYIFGDEYSGSSFEPVLATLDRLNANRTSGARLSRVHAVGFISEHTTERFPILMREVTRRHGGSFLALSR